MKWIAVVCVVLLIMAALGVWLWTPDRDRSELEATYSRGSGDFVTVAGIRLHVRDTGPHTAPALILLHGFGASLHTWETWAHSLAGDYRVIRFDLPGAGLTGPDPTEDYADTRALQLLTALMDHLGIARASLIGHSIGGRIAWRFAAEHPSRVDRLVLVAPDGFQSPGFEYGKSPAVPSIVGVMRYALPASVLRMNLTPAFADPTAVTDALLTRYHDMMRAPGVRGAMIARMRQTVLQDPVPFLRRIEAPTLLLWGEKDAMIPVANAQDYVQALRRSTLVTLPGVGHVPQEEAPGQALEAVSEFLKR